MNEHIRELMRGAMADAWMQADRDGDMDKMYIPALFAENFAELIVKDCIQYIENPIAVSRLMTKYGLK